MKMRLRGVSRRFGWGLADQAVSSLTNFAVSLYVAHSLGLVQFGAFSLAYVTYSFILNASRGLATDPLLVRFSGAQQPAWRRAVGSCTGTALAVGLVGGAAMLAVSTLLTLFVVPAAYSSLDDVLAWGARRREARLALRAAASKHPR